MNRTSLTRVLRLVLPPLICVPLALFLSTAPVAAAQPPAGEKPAGPQRHMSEGSIRGELLDTPLEGHYTDGKPWQETYFSNGSITYKDPNADWQGRWSFEGTAFCTFYNDGRNGGCWRIVKDSGNCYYFFGLRRSGQPFPSGKVPRRNWLARGWRKSEPSSCDVDVGA